MMRSLRPAEATRETAPVLAPTKRGPSPWTRRRRAGPRRGIATLWTIIFLPALVTMLVVVVEVSHQWHARGELQNALESGVLAAVKRWGDLGGASGNIASAETMGKEYTRANTINGVQVDLDNAALVPSVTWAFGSAAPSGTGYHFTPDPSATAHFAVVLQATFTVTRLCNQVFGHAISNPTVTVQAAAYYDPSVPSARPKLIRLD